MSLAITHFAVGATGTLLLLAIVAPNARYSRTLVLVGGGWALVPEAGHLYAHPTLLALHESRWADLFWFHSTMDRLDPTNSVVLGSLALAMLLATSLILEHRSSGVAHSNEATSGASVGTGTD